MYLEIVVQLLGALLIVVRAFVRANALTIVGGHLDSGHLICSHVDQVAKGLEFHRCTCSNSAVDWL